MDPALFEVLVRVKKPEDLDEVRDRILTTIQGLREKPVEEARLDTVRKHLRYQLALSMDNSETIAQIIAGYVALRRTPDTLNKLFEQYAALTPDDVRRAAEKYLTENARTIVTLRHTQEAK
jgi:zinc protease